MLELIFMGNERKVKFFKETETNVALMQAAPTNSSHSMTFTTILTHFNIQTTPKWRKLGFHAQEVLFLISICCILLRKLFWYFTRWYKYVQNKSKFEDLRFCLRYLIDRWESRSIYGWACELVVGSAADRRSRRRWALAKILIVNAQKMRKKFPPKIIRVLIWNKIENFVNRISL